MLSFRVQKSSYISIKSLSFLILVIICCVFSNSNNHGNAVKSCDIALQTKCEED